MWGKEQPIAGTVVNAKTPSTSPFITEANANVQVRFARFCDSTEGNFYAAWTMIAVSNSSGLNGWMQIGWWMNTDLCCLRHFWQYTKGGDVKTASWGTPLLNNDYFYQVFAYANNTLGVGLVEGQAPPCNQAGDCPRTDWALGDPCCQSSNAQFFGETLLDGTDIPGDLTQGKTNFTSLSETWNGTSKSYAWLNLHGDCLWFKVGATNPNSQFRIWTDPISHNHTC